MSRVAFMIAAAVYASLPLAVHGDGVYFRSEPVVAKTLVRVPDSLEDGPAQKWRVAIDSGHSSPVVCKGRIFFSSYNSERKELAVVAHDVSSGAQAWKRVVEVPQIESFHRGAGNAAQATPAFDGTRLYSFFGSYGLVCHDLEGNLIWSHRMGPFQDEYGSGSSPVVLDGTLFVQQDHDVDSFLMALEAATGKVLWRKARPDAVRSYSTPAIWEQDGRRLLLVAGALELAAHDIRTGERVWSINGLARIVIPAPVVSGDTIYMASWAPGGDAGRRIQFDDWSTAIGKWDANGDGKLSRTEVKNPDVLDRFFRMDLDQNGTLDRAEWERHARFFSEARNSLFAIRPGLARGEISPEKALWRVSKGIPYVSSPVVHDGAVWMVKDGGIVTKVETSTGRILIEERLPGAGNYFASPIIVGDQVLFAGEQGQVTLVPATGNWRVTSTRDFKEKIYSTPAAGPDGIFIRTEKALYRFQP